MTGATPIHTPLLVQTGDVLACYGQGLVSGLIGWLTPRWRIWRRAPSHVAVIVCHPDVATSKRSGYDALMCHAWVYESTSLSKLKDAFDSRQRSGIQAHALLDWLDGYQGKVVLHQLKTPMTPSGGMRAVAYAKEAHARQVRYNRLAAYGSASVVIKNTENGEPLFCSAFAAYLLKKGGSLGSQVNAAECHPLDVVGFPCFEPGVTIKPFAGDVTPAFRVA